MMDNDNGEPDTFQTPSRAQELTLAILPIPSAILSILGSSIIIYMSVSTRRQRKWTPYTRLLLFLSFYDIIASTTLGMAIFLRDKETSSRPFSFGSSGTCTMVGFFNQLSYGTLFYNGSLSLYFLLTARFGYSNAYIARVIEPWIHLISNGFAFCTSIVALGLGAFDEMTQGNGCWVANYPRGCKEDGTVCKSRLMGWVYFGLPAISVFILLFVFNSMIFVFVRRHQIPIRLSKPEAEGAVKSTICRDESSSSYDDHEDLNIPRRVEPAILETSEANDERESQKDSQLRDQARRLRLVSTQAFLYVAFFLLCNVWTGVVGVIESSGSTEEEEMHLLVVYYIIFLLQAVLAPLQGVFNMAVFIRPKLHLCATAFPKETRLWILRRTILGNCVKPTCSYGGPSRDPRNDTKQKEASKDKAALSRLPRDMISSVTASEGDFTSEVPLSTGKDERWATGKEKSFGPPLASVPIRFESLQHQSSFLEVISENETSTFDFASRISIAEELLADMYIGDFFPSNAEKRWSSDSIDPASSSSGSGPAPVPKREVSIVEVEEPDQSSSFRHLHGHNPDKEPVPISADQPMKAPQRCSEIVSGSRPMPIPQRKENTIEEPDQSSSFRHLHGHNPDKEPVSLPADQPVKAPQRCSEIASGSRPMPIPQTKENTFEEPDQSSSFRHLHDHNPGEVPPAPLPADQPMRIPQRRPMPDSPSFERKTTPQPELQGSFRQVTETDDEKDEVKFDA